jgi:hypothetical protein
MSEHFERRERGGCAEVNCAVETANIEFDPSEFLVLFFCKVLQSFAFSVNLCALCVQNVATVNIRVSDPFLRKLLPDLVRGP